MNGVDIINVCDDDFLYITSIICFNIFLNISAERHYFMINMSPFEQILNLTFYSKKRNYLKMLFLISLQENIFLIFTKK